MSKWSDLGCSTLSLLLQLLLLILTVHQSFQGTMQLRILVAGIGLALASRLGVSPRLSQLFTWWGQRILECDRGAGVAPDGSSVMNVICSLSHGNVWWRTTTKDTQRTTTNHSPKQPDHSVPTNSSHTGMIKVRVGQSFLTKRWSVLVNWKLTKAKWQPN